MKSSRLPLLLLAGTSAAVIGCSSVPLTGRTQLNLIPSSEILALNEQEYATFFKSGWG